MRYLTFAFIALFFVACGDADTAKADMNDAVADTETVMDTKAAAAKAEAASFLQTTVAAVQSAGGDITALAPEAAANNINGWITKLSDVDGAEGVVDGLAQLKKVLMVGDIDGGQVSEILSGLATETRGMSAKVPALSTLANVLQAGADKLAGK